MTGSAISTWALSWSDVETSLLSCLALGPIGSTRTGEPPLVPSFPSPSSSSFLYFPLPSTTLPLPSSLSFSQGERQFYGNWASSIVTKETQSQCSKGYQENLRVLN